jgi:hypothetical protein
MSFKKSVVTAAVTAALGLGVSGQANAYLYAAAGLSIDALIISITPTPTINRFDFTIQDTAVLNGAGDFHSNTCGGTPGANTCGATPAPPLDAPPANAPGGTLVRPNNSTTGGEFTFFGPLSGFTGNFSNSDVEILSAELVNGTPTSTREIAESLISTASTASASADIQSITGFSITFTTGGGTFSATANIDPDLRAAIFGEGPGTFSAQANLNGSFTLVQNTGGSGFATWTPRGTAANDCIASGGLTCTETADSQNLSVNVGTTTNNTADNFSWDPNVLTATPFGFIVTGLTAGTYTLTFREAVSTQLARQVPEPGTLALIGVGILGVFASMRRRNRA